MRTNYRAEPPWPHRVLVLGGGFAGVETARHLEKLTRRRADIEVDYPGVGGMGPSGTRRPAPRSVDPRT